MANNHVTNRSYSWLVPLIIIGAIIIIGFVLFAGFGKFGALAPNEESPQDNTATINNIVENPERYTGQQITLTGTVDEILGPRVFTLNGNILGNELVIISRQELPEAMFEEEDVLSDRQVRVTGVVRQFVLAEVEREVGFDLDPEIEVEIEENQPVVIVSSIRMIPENN